MEIINFNLKINQFLMILFFTFFYYIIKTNILKQIIINNFKNGSTKNI